MKFSDRNNYTDWLKFNAKTGWIEISEKEDGFHRRKVGMFINPEEMDALILELERHKRLMAIKTE